MDKRNIRKVKLQMWNKVQQAASRLDCIAPGWFREIDLHKFDMMDCRSCVGHYVFDSSSFWRIETNLSSLNLDLIAFGFSAQNLFRGEKDNPGGWEVPEWYSEMLNSYWRKMITRRLDSND